MIGLRHQYAREGWNRLVEVRRAYRDANGDVHAASLVATMRYDGLHRRIRKSIENSADWNATYHCGNMTWRRGDGATKWRKWP